MLHFCSDKSRFEEEFRNPGIPESGIAADRLQDELAKFLKEKNFSSHLEEHLTAFTWLLENFRIGVSPGDLFVTLGFWGRKPIEELLGLPRRKHVTENLCAGTLDFRIEFGNAGFGSFFWDYAHSVPDWQKILTKGLPALTQEAEAAYQRFKLAHKNDITPQQEQFFHVVICEYQQTLRLLDRILIWAEKVNCQQATLAALRSLRRGAPQNFYEAMLLIWLFYQLSEYGDCIQTRSFGNLDLMLYPYYKRDLDSGTFTKDDKKTVGNEKK